MTTDSERKAHYEAKKREYPYEVLTEGVKESPHAEEVDSARYGDFVRIPFPNRNYVVWLFTTQTFQVMFQNDFRGKFG